ncbi:MAG TPA: type II secretion system F family protein [Nitrososphaerales archaeon]|nr:type II secretion system F family protein [Nitrososphaerales archaeon]
MALGWRERLELKVRVRYRVKRTYFTLLAPALIAITIMGFALYSGFAPLPNLSAVSQAAPTASAAQVRLQQFEKLFGNSTTAPAVSNLPPPPSPHNFDLVLVVSLVVGLAPYAADSTLAERKRRRYEADFADFLFEMSELVRGGIDPIKAVNTLAEGSLGSITRQVKVAAKQMQMGYTFEQAMRNLATTLKSSLIARYVDLVIQASYSGGGVSNLIQRASADMGTFINIEREKRAGLSQYTLILYVGQVVLIALCAILVVQFLPELSQISLLGSSSFTGSLLAGADIGSVPLERDLFYLLILNGVLGGLVIGKISEGKIKHGIKHSLILVLIAFVAWAALVTPAISAAGPHYSYSIVSYSKQGLTGLPMSSPLEVVVNQTDGSPATGVLVQFSISGSGGGGTVIPSAVNTDTNGEASATVILGNSSGIYSVGITVGGNTTAVQVEATTGTGG